MLRAFFVLLPLVADKDTVDSLCQEALIVGLTNSCVLVLVGFLFVFSRLRHAGKGANHSTRG